MSERELIAGVPGWVTESFSEEVAPEVSVEEFTGQVERVRGGARRKRALKAGELQGQRPGVWGNRACSRSSVFQSSYSRGCEGQEWLSTLEVTGTVIFRGLTLTSYQAY